MLAPVFHPAMKFAAAPRKEVGIRTVFNILGPLTNPASAKAQVLGVPKKDLTEKMAAVLKCWIVSTRWSFMVKTVWMKSPSPEKHSLRN